MKIKGGIIFNLIMSEIPVYFFDHFLLLLVTTMHLSSLSLLLYLSLAK